MVFLAPCWSCQFRKINIREAQALMLVGITIGALRIQPHSKGFVLHPEIGRIMSAHMRSGLSICTQLRGISEK
jgi:hypothetical protein